MKQCKLHLEKRATEKEAAQKAIDAEMAMIEGKIGKSVRSGVLFNRMLDDPLPSGLPEQLYGRFAIPQN